MRVAYFHSIGGASGDMVLGALVDAGLPLETLADTLAALPIPGLRLQARQERRAGLLGTHVLVETDPAPAHPRTLAHFLDLVAGAPLSAEAKKKSSRILQRLGEAESRAHRAPAGAVPLHELGEWDTLVDVVGAVVGLEVLGVMGIFSSPLLAGVGVIASSHGPLPVPAPVTLELIADAQAPVSPPGAGGPPPGEVTTPTAAAILTTLASFDPPVIAVERAGYGLGTRDTPQIPNALAVWLGEARESSPMAGLRLLETNIDDAPPELLGYTLERLLELGALDVWFTAIQMKKNRPGVLLSALVPGALEAPAAELILRETTTLGVRVRSVERYEAARETVMVETPFGTVPVKVKRMGGAVVGISPEYEVCRNIAQERSLPLAEVYRQVTERAGQQLLGSP